MYRITYTIPIGEKDQELKWLRDIKVFPVTEPRWDLTVDKDVLYIGAIVDDETVVTIKLRRQLRTQVGYKGTGQRSIND